MDLGGMRMEYKYYQNTLNKILKEQIKSQKNLKKLKIKTYIGYFLREVGMYMNYLKIEVKKTQKHLKRQQSKPTGFLKMNTFKIKKN